MGAHQKPRAGSKLEWVAQRLKHSNAELFELATKAKLDLTLKKIARMRSVLKTKYGMKSSGGKRGGARQRPTAAPARKAKPNARDTKRAAVHRLFFELGFDEVRDLFDG